MRTTCLRVYAFAFAALAMTASPALAQFTSRSIGDPATGEKYHIEAAAGLWRPNTEMAISSESLGIPGDTIDFKRDLGLENHTFQELHFTLRPAKKHKFRYQYIPMRFEQIGATITRTVVFNGQQFTIGVPVNSLIDWKAHRFAYEYDFVSLDRGFVGFVMDAKYTDVLASLESPTVRKETAHAAAPIPTVGGIFRAYVMPNISITGEMTGFKMPKNVIKGVEDAHYFDVDFYATVNFTNNIGAQIGYRSFDVGYIIDEDTGNFTLKGFYFGAVARY